jgi:hypothetical protein
MIQLFGGLNGYTETSEVGQVRVNSLGRTRVAPKNLWILSSEGSADSLDVRRHLDWLLARLVPNAKALLELQEVEGLVMTVHCVWYSRSGHGGPTLWPEQMRALADLNLECGFDVYFLENELLDTYNALIAKGDSDQ